MLRPANGFFSVTVSCAGKAIAGRTPSHCASGSRPTNSTTLICLAPSTVITFPKIWQSEPSVVKSTCNFRPFSIGSARFHGRGFKSIAAASGWTILTGATGVLPSGAGRALLLATELGPVLGSVGLSGAAVVIAGAGAEPDPGATSCPQPVNASTPTAKAPGVSIPKHLTPQKFCMLHSSWPSSYDARLYLAS